tara:strand:- start:1144 stop:1449 length:306 start_codon:yes stop_codon:yes gene_type:complete
MLNYKFNQALVRTSKLLKKMDLPESTLDFWKAKWREDGNSCYSMGLRLIANKAYWCPIQFVNWMAQYKLTNKPTDKMQRLEQQKLVAFVINNVEKKKRAIK